MEPLAPTATPRCLTERDFAILRYLEEAGFASARWIQDEFWRGQSNCHHYRRLSRLRQLGLVEYLIGDGGIKLGYRLSAKGAHLLKGAGMVDANQAEVRSSYRTNFNHDEQLLGLRNVLKSLPNVSNYVMERAVRQRLAKRHGHRERRKDGYKVPDALFELATNAGRFRVALELELAVKNRAYYRQVLRRLLVSTDFDLVFVVGKDEKSVERLMRLLHDVRAKDPWVKIANRDNGIYFSVLPEVLLKRQDAEFRGEGGTFTLRDLTSFAAR